jgi:hypothetical protein
MDLGYSPLIKDVVMGRFSSLAAIATGFLLLGGGQAKAQSRVQGDWLATLTVTQASTLHLAFHVKSTEHGLTATMDSLDQGVSDLPLVNVEGSARHLSFDAPTIGGRYAGAWDAKANGYVGEWSQGARRWPMTLLHGQVETDHHVVRGVDGS